MLIEILYAQAAGRGDGNRPHGLFFRNDIRKSAIAFLVGFDGCGRGVLGAGRKGAGAGHQTAYQEGSPRLIGLCRCRTGMGRLPFPGEPVFQSAQRAGIHAVETNHATAMVDGSGIDIDTGGLAIFFAMVAPDAYIQVQDRAEEGEPREESQRRAHRAEGIAPSPAVFPGQDRHGHQGGQGNQEGRQAAQPDLAGIEGIAASPFGYPGQQVVAPDVQGLEKILDDPSPGAVRGQQCHEDMYAGQQGRHEQHPNPIPEPFPFGRGRKTRLFPLAAAAQVRYDILPDAQGADDGAVHAAEQEGQQEQAHDDGQVQGQDGREELDLGHPAQPNMQGAGNIQQQQRDADKKQGRQGDSDFLVHKRRKINSK